MPKILTLYKRAIEELGLRQLDVYRVVAEDEKTKARVEKDIVRVFDPATNKVVLIDLGRIREALQPLEYIDAILEALKKNEIPFPERKANELREAFKRLQEASSA